MEKRPTHHQTLRACLPPGERLLVDELNLTLWTRPGKFRAYGSRTDAYLELNPALVPEELADMGSSRWPEEYEQPGWAEMKGY